MLKALELAGFKSFADKTRFEFPPGITVVVGPNGSGKSNVVDSIKWVMGEQSAKSLRGKEMADCIFKGTASGNRKPANSAEATIVFDNIDQRLLVDAPEVHVTRRVYRSGEGEYLINGQACRLRDIKDAFSGTGVGADAYSIIEQGKVDTLLQSSSKDRRAIFEESAGISRFKSKKVEAQRRLERVDQNMLRLSDIVEEVGNRLKTVRSQAAKARRFKEYSDRLQELRTQVALTDWRQLSEKLQSIESELQQTTDEVASIGARCEFLEAENLGLETTLIEISQRMQSCDSRASQQRDRINSIELTAQHDRQRVADLETEAGRQRRQTIALSHRAGDVKTQLAQLEQAVGEARREHSTIQQRQADHQTHVTSLTATLDQTRQQGRERSARHQELTRQASALASRIAAAQATSAAAMSQVTSAEQRLAHWLSACQQHADELALHEHQQAEQTAEVRRQEMLLRGAQEELAASRRSLEEQRRKQAQLEGQHTRAVERSALLEDLERRREGLGSGVREALDRARDGQGAYRQIRGMVADLIQVSVEYAPLVEAALGSSAQHLVIEGDEITSLLQSEPYTFSGRVGFTPLIAAREDAALGIDLTGQPGVIGRVDRLVQCDAAAQPLAERLLGDAWGVETLADALRLRRSGVRSVRMITKNGQMLRPDGTMVVGPRHASIGVISRRSELRALRAQIEALADQLALGEQQVATTSAAVTRQDQEAQRLGQLFQQAVDKLADCRVRTQGLWERLQQGRAQQAACQTELASSQSQQDAALAEIATLSGQQTELESQVAAAQVSLENDARKIAELEAERQSHLREVTAAKVELAKSEQRLEGLVTTLGQFQADQREREKNLTDARNLLAQLLRRGQETELKILTATAELAEVYLLKDSLTSQSRQLVAQRDEATARRAAAGQETLKLRRQVARLQEKQHQQELSANQVRHERTTLEQRLREDYGIELSELTHEPSDEEQTQRTEVDNEIAELRRKISNIGAVNMDALAELEDLEARYTVLEGQHSDLVSAKESLEKIIQKINADSRRLFTETLEAIRANFQILFRKVFGGGRADIVLEEGVDVLEAGVDIIANPPGKQALHISLLSGGERALTAVTLLLAIFQFRPSPFCVLDEVDGPLDEANIGRFVDVLKEFLQWTKFVIVTHSKKTMSAANTLYGVTMQESGVSKRVSVQFDDVSENGQISDSALLRQGDAEKSSSAGAA